MSGMGHKQTYTRARIYVRYRGLSGHNQRRKRTFRALDRQNFKLRHYEISTNLARHLSILPATEMGQTIRRSDADSDSSACARSQSVM